MLQQSPIYVYFPARDMARARQFYEGKLGFKPRQEVNGGVVYPFGGSTAAFLYLTPNAGSSKASQAFWAVDDVEQEMAELKRRGVVFEDYDMPGERSPSGAITAGGAKAAWFKDSEGNILALIQSLAGKATAEFHGVRYLVTDVKRALDFYVGRLGFEVEHQQLPAFATVALGALKILLSGPDASGSRPLPGGGRQSPGGSNRVVLRVKGLPAVVEALRSAGAAFRNTIETGPAGSQIQLLDPDGNPVELFEPARRE